MSKMNIAVAGASGRMGRMLIEAIVADPDAVLAGALDIPASPAIGTDAAAFLAALDAARPTKKRVVAARGSRGIAARVARVR